MPFITIELPVTVEFALAPFAGNVHEYLSHFLAIPIEKLKTKLIRPPEVFVGRGDPSHVYAHLQIALMTGRDKQKLAQATQELLGRFKAAIAAQNPEISCRVTCAFHEIDRELLYADTL